MKHNKSKKTLKDLANEYGVKLPTLKLWRQKGIDVYDNEAVQEQIKTSGVVSISTPRLKSQGINLNDKQVGLRAECQRLASATLDAATQYNEAIKQGDDYLINSRSKLWQSMADQLRKIEGDLNRIEQEQNQSMPITELKQTLTQYFSPFREDLENLGKKLSKLCQNKTEKEIEKIVESEIKIIIQNIYDCKMLIK